MTSDNNGEDILDVSDFDRPTVTLSDWDSDTITVTVLGNNGPGTFKRARLWINRNTDVPVEPVDGRSPVSVEELKRGKLMKEWSYRFRRLD